MQIETKAKDHVKCVGGPHWPSECILGILLQSNGQLGKMKIFHWSGFVSYSIETTGAVCGRPPLRHLRLGPQCCFSKATAFVASQKESACVDIPCAHPFMDLGRQWKERLWPLDFCLLTFQHKTVFLLVSSWSNEISPLLALPGKIPLATHCKIHYWPPLEKVLPTPLHQIIPTKRIDRSQVPFSKLWSDPALL